MQKKDVLCTDVMGRNVLTNPAPNDCFPEVFPKTDELPESQNISPREAFLRKTERQMLVTSIEKRFGDLPNNASRKFFTRGFIK